MPEECTSDPVVVNGFLYIGAKSHIYCIGNIPPRVEIIRPGNNTVIGGITEVEVSASDAAGIEKVEFYLDGQLIYVDRESPWVWSFDTTLLSDGKHVISVTAYDSVGEHASCEVHVLVDNTPPELRIISPVDGATISENTFIVNITANDVFGISYVELYIDDDFIHRFTDYKTTYIYTVNATKYAAGEHIIRAVAYDLAGNNASAVIRIRILRQEQITEPTPEPASSGGLSAVSFIVGIVIGVVITAAMSIIMRHLRKPVHTLIW